MRDSTLRCLEGAEDQDKAALDCLTYIHYSILEVETWRSKTRRLKKEAQAWKLQHGIGEEVQHLSLSAAHLHL